MLNKISALEAYKVSTVMEEFVKKLSFLDLLKQNMGEEMTEQMSEEITKAMDEQRSLEQQYAQLVTRRGQLKGLSHKAELEETKENIKQVSKDLKQSTKILCRQLQDNPDVTGNQQLIKKHKIELQSQIEDLVDEMMDSQNYTSFKQKVDKELNDRNEFDKLHQDEKDLNTEIKTINENLKKKMDEFAKEAQESSDDISRLKKQVNECKTQSELEIQYKMSEIKGDLACMQRGHSMLETSLRNKIKDLQQQLEVEKQVSERIRGFIQKKKDVIDAKSEQRDKLREKKVQEIEVGKTAIKDDKDDAEHKIEELHHLCEEEDDNRKQREIKDQENASSELQKQQEKIDMDLAAKYIQRKWNWFQTEGKFLAKKRKGKKGKGKKKKKS